MAVAASAARVVRAAALPGPFGSICQGIAATPSDEVYGPLSCSSDVEDPDAPGEPRSEEAALAEPAPPFLRAAFVWSYSAEWGDQAGGAHLAVRTDAGWFVERLHEEPLPGGAGLIANDTFFVERPIVTREVGGVRRLVARYTRGTESDYQYAGPEPDDDGPVGHEREEHALVCAAVGSSLRCADLLVGGDLAEEHLVHDEQSFERRWRSTLELAPGDRVILERSGDLPDGVEAREEVQLRFE